MRPLPQRNPDPTLAVADLGVLSDQVVSRALSPGIDERWLDAQPDLLHLGTRKLVSDAVAQRLDASDVLPDAVDLLALSRFFQWEGRLQDPPGPADRVLQRMRAEAQLRLEAEIPDAVDVPGYLHGRVARLLLAPFHWWPHVRFALDHPGLVLDRLAAVKLLSEGQQQRILDPATLRFWQQLASGRTWCRPVLQLCLVQALAVWLVLASVNWMNTDGGLHVRLLPFIPWAWFPLLLPLAFALALATHHQHDSSQALRVRARRGG